MKLKKLKRIFCGCLAALLLLSCLASCTDRTSNEDGTKESDTEKEIMMSDYKELIIVRSSFASDSVASLCVALRDQLKAKTELEVTVKSDSVCSYEAAEGRGYLLVGDTSFDLSKKAAESGSDGCVVFLSEADTTAVYTVDDTLAWLGVQIFLNENLQNGKLAVGGETTERVEDLSKYTREGWKQPFPAYPHGQLDKTLYSCGTGAKTTEKKSEMQLIQKTNEVAYNDYLSALEAFGYTVAFSNYIDGNYYTLINDLLGTNFYIYYMTENGETGDIRAIVDRSSATLEEFCYTTAGSDKTELFLFNSNTSSEDTFLIHAADNSWIFIDGGVTEYGATDLDAKFADALFNFMWKESGLKDGEKLSISCWYMSHAHRDHFLAFSALIEKYHDRIDLQRMLANVPDNANLHSSQLSNYPQFEICMNRINKYYPDLLYMKAHTGMKIQIADVEFTVLNTQEDLIDYWVNNRKIFEEKWLNWSQYKNDPNYASYRDGYKRYDYNNSSIISIISVNGLTMLQTGDSYRFHEWTAPNYKLSTMRTDIIKAAHHFINEETVDFYKPLFDHNNPFYFIINHTSYNTSNNKKLLLNAMSAAKGQLVVEASYTKIFGFKEVNGSTVKREIPATYSYATN